MNAKTARKIIVITGATASGKTKLAIQLAKKIDAVVICADSRIVYKNLDIVSAKPTIEEREGILHYLIDIVEPNYDFSAGDFVRYSKTILEENKDKNVIISGGTWFYIKSLLDKESLIETKKNVSLREELNKLTNNEIWNKLNSLDPKRASLIHPNNKDKVIRSIEMCLELKQPVSEYKRKENQKYGAVWFMPSIEREKLYQNINKRVDIMLEAGLYDEWQKNKELYPNSTVLKNTIGYKEFFELEDKKYPDFKTAVEKIKQHTRNFSKRQLTYFRSNPDIKAINNVDEIIKDVDL